MLRAQAVRGADNAPALSAVQGAADNLFQVMRPTTLRDLCPNGAARSEPVGALAREAHGTALESGA